MSDSGNCKVAVEKRAFISEVTTLRQFATRQHDLSVPGVVARCGDEPIPMGILMALIIINSFRPCFGWIVT